MFRVIRFEGETIKHINWHHNELFILEKEKMNDAWKEAYGKFPEMLVPSTGNFIESHFAYNIKKL